MISAIFPLGLVQYIVRKPKLNHVYNRLDGSILKTASNHLAVVCFAMGKHLYNTTGFHVQYRLVPATFKEIKQKEIKQSAV